MSKALKRSILSVSNVPMPVMYLIASVAWMEPRIPGTTPRMPFCEREGSAPSLTGKNVR